MSLAARCPWCETVFRLTEGQISAKGGMARCGVCGHTFNALDALLSDSAVAALEKGAKDAADEEATRRQLAANPALRPHEDTAPARIAKPVVPMAAPIAAPISAPIARPPAPPASIASPPAPAVVPQPLPVFAIDESQSPKLDAPDELDLPVRVEEVENASLNSLRVRPDERPTELSTDESFRLGPSTFQPSFLALPERSTQGSFARLLIGTLFALVLIIGLLAQAAYWWRSEIGVRAPQLKPLLVRACKPLRCSVEARADIGELSIESSELVAVPAASGVLSFSALIRNHSTNALQYPAIEVTLTDAKDQAILRRVFLPKLYLTDPSDAHLLAGVAGDSEFTIKLTFDTSGIATTGYRAGVFYP